MTTPREVRTHHLAASLKNGERVLVPLKRECQVHSSLENPCSRGALTSYLRNSARVFELCA